MSAKQRWLARVTSFAFPRTFATHWGDTGRNYLCFTAEITTGSKNAVGREVEVQIPDEDAEKLARQILRIIQARKEVGQ